MTQTETQIARAVAQAIADEGVPPESIEERAVEIRAAIRETEAAEHPARAARAAARAHARREISTDELRARWAAIRATIDDPAEWQRVKLEATR